MSFGIPEGTGDIRSIEKEKIEHLLKAAEQRLSEYEDKGHFLSNTADCSLCKIYSRGCGECPAALLAPIIDNHNRAESLCADYCRNTDANNEEMLTALITMCNEELERRLKNNEDRRS